MNLIKRFKNVFGEQKAEGQKEEVDSEERVKIASCVLLLEAASADGNIDDDERKTIFEILNQEFSLSEEDAKELVSISSMEKQESIDIYQNTKIIDKNLSYDEKVNVLVNIWKVIFADGRLDKHEDHLIHRIADLMKVSHGDFIDAKMEAKKEMGL